MEIKLVVDTLHSVYYISCNLAGEPDFQFAFKAGCRVKFRYEVREAGTIKVVEWEEQT